MRAAASILFILSACEPSDSAPSDIRCPEVQAEALAGRWHLEGFTVTTTVGDLSWPCASLLSDQAFLEVEIDDDGGFTGEVLSDATGDFRSGCLEEGEGGFGVDVESDVSEERYSLGIARSEAGVPIIETRARTVLRYDNVCDTGCSSPAFVANIAIPPCTVKELPAKIRYRRADE